MRAITYACTWAENVDANSDGRVDFLERNGLRGGTVCCFVPEAAQSSTDLPDGTVVRNLEYIHGRCFAQTKLEDVHTSPFDEPIRDGRTA